MTRSTGFGRQFQVIFEHAPIGIVVMDGTGCILYTNQALQRFLGYNDSELATTYLVNYADPDDAETFRSHYSALVEGERRTFQITGRCRKKNGDVAYWRVDTRSVQSKGQSPFILAVVDDVTDQKEDEAQLRRAKELAEEATQTKSAFLANMSHEIRTPLHTINGMSELLFETDMNEEQAEYVNSIRFAGEALLGLINDILDFSKIEAGKLHLESIEFDLPGMLEEAVDLVSIQAHRKGLELVLSVDPDLPAVVTGDPSRIRQVLVNLVNNATKFTGEGEIKVSAERAMVDGAVHLLLQVRDTGIGIPEERQKQLFRPFSQVDASTTRKFGGTGLGLSISRDLIKMMGGTIGVRSREEVGSNFWFSIPLDVVRESDRMDRRPEGLEAGAPVLIVDDSESSRETIRQILTMWGCDIHEATDAPLALEMLEKGPVREFVVTLIDLRLPTMDGWQFASELHDSARQNFGTLILMSPSGMSTGEAKMKLLRWFDAYINKPVKMLELADAIERTQITDIEELEAVTVEAVDGAEELESTGHERTILVAEDHFVNQQLFRAILEKEGCNVFLASNGLEAVEKAISEEVDLVFMDVQMPEMNGYEATRAIRRRGLSMPVVAVTANALKGERERCLRSGMNDYMSKPFKRRDVVYFLERLGKGEFEQDELTLGGVAEVPEESRVNTAILDGNDDDAPVDDISAVEELLDDVEDVEEPADASAPAEDGLPPLNYGAALESFMGDADVLKRVLSGYADRLGPQLDLIATSIEKNDFPRARIEAHAIKGGSWNLSAQALGDAAKLLEDSTNAGEYHRSLELFKDVKAEAERVIVFVRSLPE